MHEIVTLDEATFGTHRVSAEQATVLVVFCLFDLLEKNTSTLNRRFVGTVFMSRTVSSPFATYPLSHMMGISSIPLSATQGLAHD